MDVTDILVVVWWNSEQRSIHHGAGFVSEYVPDGGDWQAPLSNFFA